MCEFKRNCPSCHKEICYKSKYNFINAEKKGSNCKSCGIKKTITPERKKQMSERVKGDKNPMYGMYGEKNPFYGKKHTKETIQKMTENRDMTVYKTKDFRDKMSKVTSGKNNPMHNRSVYDVWLEKFGKEIADKKLEDFKLKLSISFSGKNNPMYGKPSPKGSGNGWSGWYKGWFFRSLKELSYMINVIERFDLSWESAENSLYTIEYSDYNGVTRTYTPDFIINNKYLVEIKPKKLWNSDNVTRKTSSAIKFCEKNNLIYKIRDIETIPFMLLHKLYENKVVIFTDRYEKKFIDYSKNFL